MYTLSTHTVCTPSPHIPHTHAHSNFNHENIVKVLGVCVDNDPVYIIMELMPAGDLLKFLRDAKREHVRKPLQKKRFYVYFVPSVFCVH